jgi:beta-glucosidase-like glycosyl hydrolase
MLRRRSSRRVSASARKLRCGSSSASAVLFCIELALNFLLLSRNLNQQALAQIPGAHPGGIKMLHQVDGAAHQVQRLRRIRLPHCVAVARPADWQRGASSSSLAAR